jgi:hypothetical protein
MRVPWSLARTIVVVAALTMGLPALVAAATSAEIVTRAESYGMTCVPAATEVRCDRVGTEPFGIHAVIKPRSGHEASLQTHGSRNGTIPGSGLDTATRKWMADLQTLACGSATGVEAFIDLVGDLTKTGSVPTQTIGDCRFDGNMVERSRAAGGDWYGQSVFIPPAPTPTPTPSASPSPMPSPSPAPTSSTPPIATPTATTAVPTPAATTVAADQPTATPGPPGPPGDGTPTPAPSAPTFEQSVLGVEGVSSDGGAVGGNLLLALMLLLLIAFAAELFNNTVENNYDVISGWFRKGPLGWLRRVGGALGGEARVGLLLFLALTAFISSFVDPHFGFDLRSLGEFLGFLVGLVVVLASFKLPPMLARKRRTGELGRLRPLPWALVIAALFVLISRLGNLQPGYLYGIVLGAIFVREVPKKEEGRETFYGSLWTLGAAGLAWLGLTWARGLGYDPNGFGITLLSTAFAAILVAGLEATAFGLMPLRFMPGHAVYTWNRLGWGVLFGLSVFAFIHLLISPTSGYVSDLSPQAFIAACGVFAAFGTLSIVTWAYFRFRPKSSERAPRGG